MIRDFQYFSPKTLEEALALLSEYRGECKLLAGGQSLLILMRQGLVAPDYLIDIKGLSELDYIRSDTEGGLRIGALCTHRAIEKSPAMKNGFSVLAEMEHRLASIQTRNWGTIGGNICHADPAGDPTSVLIALDASVGIASLRGRRHMALEDFCLNYFETALGHDEILAEIQVPPVPSHTGTAYAKFNIIQSDMATVAAAVSVSLDSDQDTCKDVRIVLGACAPTQMRAKQAEALLRGEKITDSLLREAGQVASQEAEPISDISASEEYRRELVKVLVARVGQTALARARKA